MSLCSREQVASSGLRQLAIVAAGFVLAGAPRSAHERKSGAEILTAACKGKLPNRK